MSDQGSIPNIHIGGSVKGQHVVIDSTQTIHGDLTITVGTLPTASEDVREQLKAEIAKLLAELEKVPRENTNQVQQVKMAAEDAVAEADKPQPNKERLVIRGENLIKAAKNLLAVAPIVVEIARTVRRIG